MLIENVALAVMGGMGVWLAYRGLTTPPRVRLTKDLEEIRDAPEGLTEKLQLRLSQAGFEITAREFLAAAGGLGLGAGALAFLLTGQVVMVAIALALAPLLYWGHLENRRDERVRAYREALADGVDIIKEAFGVTPNIQHGIQAVAEDGPPQLQADFRQMLALLHQGASLEEATEPAAERRQDLFFDMLREALVLREAEGGSIRKVLDSISTLVREQGRIYREMLARQTQTRLEANIVCVAPFALFILIKLTMPEYAGPFYATPSGQLVLVAAAALDLIAYWLTKKIATSGMEIARVEWR